MSIPDFWSVSGVVFKVDGFTPFTTSDGLKVEAYDFCNNTETSLGWQPGLDANGNFSIGFNKWQFKDVIPGHERPAPNIYFRVYDDLHRVIYQSHAGFVPPSASSTVDITVERMPVPTDWHVRGMAYELDETTPYVNGNLAIYRVRAGQSPHRLALTGLSNFVNAPDLGPGYFQLTFSRGDFQHGNNEISAPGEVFFRIYDLQNSQQVIWESNVIIISDSESTVRLVVPEHAVLLEEDVGPSIPDEWSVSGTITDERSDSGLVIVKAYDLLPSGQPVQLGKSVSPAVNGFYKIVYSEDDFPGRPVPDLFVRVYSAADDTELAWGEPETPVTHNTTINITIPASEISPARSVSGIIRDKNLQPLQGINVRAYDALSPDVPLGGIVQSGADGSYHIEYYWHVLLERLVPDVFIRVYYEVGEEVARSDVVEQAPQHVTINLALPDEWAVCGIVRSSQGSPVTLGSVRAYDCYADVETLLGEVNLNSTGQYLIEYDKNRLLGIIDASRTAPNIKARFFYPHGTVLAESDVFNNAERKQTVNLTINSGVSGDPEFGYCVFGHVTNRAQLPVAHHPVKAYALRITNDEFEERLLGVIPTDIFGYYEINYDPANLEFPIDEDPAAHGAETVALFIKLPRERESSEVEIIYDTSPIVCHSAKRQQIDIRVDRLSGSDSSEYDIVRSALTAYISVMKDTIDRREPSFSNHMRYISCKTGVDEIKVTSFFHSEHFSKRVVEELEAAGSDWELNTDCDFNKFMYATFRAGYPNSVSSLCAANVGEYYMALVDSFKNGIISESSTVHLFTFWNQWLRVVRTLVAASEPAGAAASVGVFANTILDVDRTDTPPSEDQTRENRLLVEKVVGIYQAVRGDMSSFWDEMWANAGKDTLTPDRLFSNLFVTQLVFIHDLYAISNGFVSFAQGAYCYFAREKVGHESGKYHPPIEAFYIQNLTSVNESEWFDMTTKYLSRFADNELLRQLVGATVAEKHHILSKTTMRLFREKFPLENIIEAYIGSGDTVLEAIGEFLKSTENFDLDTANIDEYDFSEFAENIDNELRSELDDELRDMLGDEEYDKLSAIQKEERIKELYAEKLEEKLKALQRINRLTEDSAAQLYLLAGDRRLDSSYKIAVHEEEKFVAEHALGLGGVAEARQIHRLAVMYATEALSLLAKYHSSLNFAESDSLVSVNRGLPVQSSSSASVHMSPVQVSASSVPTPSNVSPPKRDPIPTYETLFGALSQVHFENSQSVFSASAYFVELLEFIKNLNRQSLFSRRPELQEIELTDGNAETVLPYIDIVLEILENAISPLRFFLQDVGPSGEIRKFLVNSEKAAGNVIVSVPPQLKAVLEDKRTIKIPDTSRVRESLTGKGDYYLMTGAWRILFSRKSSGGGGYLVTAYPQTSKSSSELSVVPEHRNPLAYEALSELYFPLRLPLNPGAEEVLETMRLLGVSKHDSIVALKSKPRERYNDDDAERSLVCAGLGIGQGVKDLLESSNPVDNAWELWGLQASNNYVPKPDHPEEWISGRSWIDIMSFVPEFMRRTGLDVNGIMDLFALRALHADNPITLNSISDKGKQTGDPSCFRIAGLNENNLTDIHRFIRLRNILQCTWKELDGFLISVRGKGMSDILKIIHVSKLFMSRYTISFTDMGCFWGPVAASVDKRFGKSPFEERFISKRLNDRAISVLKKLVGLEDPEQAVVVSCPIQNGNDTNNPCPKAADCSIESMDNTVKQALRQVLQLSVEDLNYIIDREFNGSKKFCPAGSIILNLTNISKILRVALLADTLKLGIKDFYALINLTGINPFEVGSSPEALLYFDDECNRLSKHGLGANAIKEFFEEASPTDKNAEWVQNTVQTLRDMVTQTETFLLSDAVPNFGKPEVVDAGNAADDSGITIGGSEGWDTFKRNYRKENTHSRVETFLTETFSEFTGGDTALANRLLDVCEFGSGKKRRKRKDESAVSECRIRDLWQRMAEVGWSLSVNANGKSEHRIVDDFSLSKDFRTNTDAVAKWSAVFIVKRAGDISLELNAGACDANFKAFVINSDGPDIEIEPDAAVETGALKITNLTVGKAVRIEIVASKFEVPTAVNGILTGDEYYLNLQWDAATETDLSGTDRPAWADVPLFALIPQTAWVECTRLASSLPVFRKMSEYLELTGVNTGLFVTVIDKARKNREWEILLPENLPLESVGPVDEAVWNKFTRLLDIQTLYRSFPIDESRLVLEDDPDKFWNMIAVLESKSNAEDALQSLADIQNRWDRTNLVDTVKTSVSDIDFSDGRARKQVQRIASPAMLTFIMESMHVTGKIGAPIDMLRSVQKTMPDAEDVENFRGALQQRIGIGSWNKMVTSMMDTMRVQKRDALTAFMTYPGPYINNGTDSSSSYVKYLHKVLVNACVLSEKPGENPEYGNDEIYNALALYRAVTGTWIIRLGPASDKWWEIGPEQWAVMDGRRGYRTGNDIYARFLIDTEMNTEMITSRIVQGSAAVQLFVQRVNLGLEPGSHLDERDRTQWAWLKNYRVWEANRKVFIYPENWIEPELRDDKTPFFEEFETEFEDGEITSEIAEKALGNFLSNIRTVAGLDIIGVYRGDSEIPGGKDTLYVIGKTKALPAQYYHRRCHRKSNLACVWTPWEEIDATIQGNSVLPVMFNGHLHVFWPQFSPVNHRGSSDDKIVTPGLDSNGRNKDITLPIPTDTTVVSISLCWSALVHNKWTKKSQTSSFVDVDNEFYAEQEPEGKVADPYGFKIKEMTGEYLQIEICKAVYTEAAIIYNVIGTYTIWHDGNENVKREMYGNHISSDPKNTFLIENYTTSFVSGEFTRSNGIKLLDRTSGGYKLITANSGLFTGAVDEPGFLLEDSGTYLVQRSDNGKTAPKYKMEVISHPIVKEFQQRLDRGGLSNLMLRETQALSMALGRYYGYSYYRYNYYYNVLLGYYTAGDWQAWDAGQNAFELRYKPNYGALSRPYPMNVVDFNYGTPNGIYNWELFFHAPFMVAKQLSANQRYEEALDWFHLIFDPRNKLSGYEKTKRWALKLPTGARFWNFLPFFANADAAKTILELMGLPDSRGTMPDSEALKTLIDDWKNDPFNPHLIARSRIVAYQKAVVMQYLDTLVAWADQKFRQDTLESVNEAIQLYILAAEVLGRRPQSIPTNLETTPLSYTQMKEMNMNSFLNVVVRLENSLIKVIADAKNTTQGGVHQSTRHALNLGPHMYYFTVPRNEKVMGYWDMLDDRLFKIRNGMNIDGVRRQLSLFAPPIDPAMLVAAAAAGIDIGTALSDAFAAIPKYRFTFMLQKAIELCNIVQSMGGAILSALEKKDAEEISRLRAEHETALLSLSREVKQMQIEEAVIAIEGLEKSRAATEFRKEHYQQLISEDVSVLENSQLKQMSDAMSDSGKAHIIRQGLSIASILPDATVGVSGAGGSPHVSATARLLSKALAVASIKAAGYEFEASKKQSSASQSGINAGYERRRQDWEFQKSLAEKEIEGIDNQMLGAQIRRQVAEKELENLEKQIEQSREIYELLKNKYTHKELYRWMIGQISTLYGNSYQLAYDVAKQAEKAYEFELGITNSPPIIKFGHWDGLRSGLLAGERLMFNLRQLEKNHIEKNNRELEITKPISIAQLDPQAILDLRQKGNCRFSLPEWLFDLDFSGHYFRRIRSVSLTIPCIAGPHTSVSAKLSLTKNSMRKDPMANPTGENYQRNEKGDTRFIDQRIGIQSIATSQPNNATGMFDFNFRDERYLPFEGAGVISDWSLELPAKELSQFDYMTISDVVLHISYTARDNGGPKMAAENWLKNCINEYIQGLNESGKPLQCILSLKQDFPDAWHGLQDSGKATFNVTAERYPYFLRNKQLVLVNGSTIHVVATNNAALPDTAMSVLFRNEAGKEYEVCTGSLNGNVNDITNWFDKDDGAVFTCTIELSDENGGKLDVSKVCDILFDLNYSVE